MGYSATEGAEAVAAVVQALSPASSSSSSCDRGMEDEVYALGLALRTLLVAYGEDEGTAMFEVRDRKKGGGGEQAAAELNFMRLTFLFLPTYMTSTTAAAAQPGGVQGALVCGGREPPSPA